REIRFLRDEHVNEIRLVSQARGELHPVGKRLKELAIVRRRVDDENFIPGLEAQFPDERCSGIAGGGHVHFRAIDRARDAAGDYAQCALGRHLSAARETLPPNRSDTDRPTFFRPVLSGLRAATEGRLMIRKLTAQSSLENLRKEAKRWLHAIRDN